MSEQQQTAQWVKDRYERPIIDSLMTTRILTYVPEVFWASWAFYAYEAYVPGLGLRRGKWLVLGTSFQTFLFYGPAATWNNEVNTWGMERWTENQTYFRSMPIAGADQLPLDFQPTVANVRVTRCSAEVLVGDLKWTPRIALQSATEGSKRGGISVTWSQNTWTSSIGPFDRFIFHLPRRWPLL